MRWRNLLGLKNKSADLAKNRLQVIIQQQRATGDSTSPDYLPMMKKEILEVIAKYTQTNLDDVKVPKENLLNVDYDEDVDASISTEFSAAAFRLGHMQVHDQLLTKLELGTICTPRIGLSKQTLKSLYLEKISKRC